LKVCFFMLCKLLRSNERDIFDMATECLDDYAHRYSRSHLTEKVEILNAIKLENMHDP